MNTKTVCHLKDGQFSIDEVPLDWIRCSVSREYRPLEEFCDSDGRFVRTNCTKTSEMDSETLSQYRIACDTAVKSVNYTNQLARYMADRDAIGSSILVSDLIAALSVLPADSRVCMTQRGYHSSGKYANIFLPELEVVVGGVNIYAIGHSEQEY